MLSSITTVLALTLVVQAVPAPPTANAVGASSYSVQAVHNKSFQRNGTAALLKAYRKWNLTPTKEVTGAFKAALNKRQDSAAPVCTSLE